MFGLYALENLDKNLLLGQIRFVNYSAKRL